VAQKKFYAHTDFKKLEGTLVAREEQGLTLGTLIITRLMNYQTVKHQQQAIIGVVCYVGRVKQQLDGTLDEIEIINVTDKGFNRGNIAFLRK